MNELRQAENLYKALAELHENAEAIRRTLSAEHGSTHGDAYKAIVQQCHSLAHKTANAWDKYNALLMLTAFTPA